MEPFWIDDAQVLFKDGAYERFIPTATMDLTSRLNAITRFCIYLACAIFLASDSDVWLYIPVTAIFIMILIWILSEKDSGDFGEGHSSDQSLRKTRAPLSSNKKTVKKRQPTYENPAMNHLPSDYAGEAKKVAERLSQSAEKWSNVNSEIDEQVYANMYKNSSDLYEQQASKRSFYSMPSTTVPNDQDAFADWCYRAPTVCKETGEGCIRYADPRNERRVSREEYII